MTLLEFEEFYLLSALVFIDGTFLSMTSLETFNSLLKRPDFVQISFLFIFKLLDLFEQGLLAMLRLQLLAHGEGHGRLIENLVGIVSHVHLITHSEQEQSSLGLIQGHLSDDLVEALAKELISHWTETRFTSLSLK